MVIVLELPPDVEAKLREDAARNDAEAVRHLLATSLAPVVDATVEALLHDPLHDVTHRADELTDEEVEALADALITLPPAIPTLADSATSRNAIYEDHP